MIYVDYLPFSIIGKHHTLIYMVFGMFLVKHSYYDVDPHYEDKVFNEVFLGIMQKTCTYIQVRTISKKRVLRFEKEQGEYKEVFGERKGKRKIDLKYK